MAYSQLQCVVIVVKIPVTASKNGETRGEWRRKLPSMIITVITTTMTSTIIVIIRVVVVVGVVIVAFESQAQRD